MIQSRHGDAMEFSGLDRENISVSESLQESYGDDVINCDVVEKETIILHESKEMMTLDMPSSLCEVDFLNSMGDINVNCDLRSQSLDPIIRRLMQEKTNILRAIEGWVASQGSDGARQPALAKIIIDWIKKANDYMKCGMKIINQINKQLTTMVSAVFSVIGQVEEVIALDIEQANKLVAQFDFLHKKMAAEGFIFALENYAFVNSDIYSIYSDIN